MITRVVFIGDLYRGDQAQNVARLERLFSPVLKQLDVASSIHVTDINRNVNLNEWVESWQKSLSACRTPEMEALDLEGAAVIGFEVLDRDLKYLDDHGVPWVNFAIHPLRFLDDLYFDVTTSFDYDLRKHTATVGLIDLCVQSLRSRYPMKEAGNGTKTIAIVGQTPYDKSVYFDGQFHRLDSYLPQLDQIVQQYDKVLYRPHPYLTAPEVDSLLTERYGAQLSTGSDIYELFITAGVSSACAISSSVLAEVPHFGIQAEYLEPRAKRYGPPINYRSLLDDQAFWATAFLGRSGSNEPVRISHAVPANYLRRIFATWGYVTDATLLERRLAESQTHSIHPLLQQVEARVQKVEEQALDQSSRAEQAEARVQKVEEQALDQSSRAEQAEARAATAEAHTQWLQNEFDTAQQKVASLSHQTGALETELAAQREQSANYEHELSATREQVSSLEAQNNLLQNEFDAAKSKVDELNRSSHHWWTVADGLNQELQSVYASKSWRITLPLRKTILAARWVLALPARTVQWALRQPKRIAKPIALWAVRQTLANPGLKVRALNVLDKHPKLKAFTMKKLSKLPWLKAHLKACMQKNSVVPTPFSPAKLIRDVSQISSKNVLLDVGQMNFSQSSTIEEDIRINLKRAVSKWPLGKRINE